MSPVTDPLKRDRWARLRFSIIGPLLAAPPTAGALHAALTSLAAKPWRHPVTGLEASFGVSTIERWYYAARRAADPVAALKNRLRGDVGRFPSLSPAAIAHLNALWHLDFHHGSRRVLTRNGSWAKPMLLGVIDDRSRLVCHLQWYLDETAESLVHGLSQAIMKRGLPRALMTDNGAAMLAEETVNGLAALSIVHQTTLPYSPYQNAKQESFWGRVEGRLMAMLEGEESLTLDLLNQATQAWVEQEYHRTLHSELGTSPLNRYLAGPNVRRECPETAKLAAAFRVEVARRQRRSDGTVSLGGARFEIPAAYRHLGLVQLRYARWDLTRVDLIDARSGVILCPVRPLDKSANADGQRKRLTPAATDRSPLPPSGIAPLLNQLLADYAATGLPPAYLPTNQELA